VHYIAQPLIFLNDIDGYSQISTKFDAGVLPSLYAFVSSYCVHSTREMKILEMIMITNALHRD
jgi:hypothetical protein